MEWHKTLSHHHRQFLGKFTSNKLFQHDTSTSATWQHEESRGLLLNNFQIKCLIKNSTHYFRLFETFSLCSCTPFPAPHSLGKERKFSATNSFTHMCLWEKVNGSGWASVNCVVVQRTTKKHFI